MSNLRLNRQPRTIIERQQLDKILKDNAKNVGVSKSNGDVISVLERPLRSNFVPFSIDGTSLIRLSDFILVMWTRRRTGERKVNEKGLKNFKKVLQIKQNQLKKKREKRNHTTRHRNQHHINNKCFTNKLMHAPISDLKQQTILTNVVSKLHYVMQDVSEY